MVLMNDVIEQKLASTLPLSRGDIAEVLTSVGKPGKMRAEKRAAIKELCERKRTGVQREGHPIWDTLEDFGEF
jgi:hypothetical protein